MSRKVGVIKRHGGDIRLKPKETRSELEKRKVCIDCGILLCVKFLAEQKCEKEIRKTEAMLGVYREEDHDDGEYVDLLMRHGLLQMKLKELADIC